MPRKHTTKTNKKQSKGSAAAARRAKAERKAAQAQRRQQIQDQVAQLRALQQEIDRAATTSHPEPSMMIAASQAAAQRVDDSANDDAVDLVSASDLADTVETVNPLLPTPASTPLSGAGCAAVAVAPASKMHGETSKKTPKIDLEKSAALAFAHWLRQSSQQDKLLKAMQDVMTDYTSHYVFSGDRIDELKAAIAAVTSDDTATRQTKAEALYGLLTIEAGADDYKPASLTQGACLNVRLINKLYAEFILDTQMRFQDHPDFDHTGQFYCALRLGPRTFDHDAAKTCYEQSEFDRSSTVINDLDVVAAVAEEAKQSFEEQIADPIQQWLHDAPQETLEDIAKGVQTDYQQRFARYASAGRSEQIATMLANIQAGDAEAAIRRFIQETANANDWSVPGRFFNPSSGTSLVHKLMHAAREYYREQFSKPGDRTEMTIDHYVLSCASDEQLTPASAPAIATALLAKAAVCNTPTPVLA